MIEASELIINPDGSIFHLHLQPNQIADTIFLVGDQGRVDMVAEFFDTIECTVQSREFRTITGTYKGTRFSVMSTGIGTDNIDISVTELDALANVDFETREPKKSHRKLNFIRIGTSGSLQEDIDVNRAVVSHKSIGFDGLLNFYANRDEVSDLGFEKSFVETVQWNEKLPAPYVVDCSEELLEKTAGVDLVPGVNISASGFYGPQGRVVRLPIVDPDINEKISSFRYEDFRITNYEMESSAIYGLSKLLGHNALTVCLIIANRMQGKANESYKGEMKNLIGKLLDCFV